MIKTSGTSAVEFPGQSRLHVGLAASDLERSEAFYTLLLGDEPSKRRPGYVKYEPEDPSVNLTLNEAAKSTERQGGPTHFGVQVKTTDAVLAAIERFKAAGIKVDVEESTTCCYAVQDKMWATDPDGNRWEVFVVLEADSPTRNGDDSTCCPDEKDSASKESVCC